MKKRHVVLLVAMVIGLHAAPAALAQVKTVWKRSAGDAGERFRLDGVPAPSRTDAAVNATMTVIAGRLDSNGAATGALHDGQLPTRGDQPDANVFFAAGSEGGRLLIDLGQVTAIQQINTYSWHPGTRGPQVYELYGSDGSAEGFDARAARTGDPATRGWTHIASVDTRDKNEPGGQYAVSTFDEQAGVLGKYRYLLLAVARTENRDPFGNTFFSEIDVVDGQVHQPVVPEPMVLTVETGPYKIDIDVTQTPELRPWVEADLAPVCKLWYPKIVDMLPSEGYTAPRRCSITFKKDMRGVAYTSRGGVTCAGPWFKRNLKGEAVGAVVHEMVHVVQQYRSARGGNRNPGWMVEGLADYIRWFLYEPASKRPHPNPARAKYTDSYRTTAAFLNYVTNTHDKDLIKKFNTAMRTGKYSPQLWIDYTGKSVDDLWADFVKTL